MSDLHNVCNILMLRVTQINDCSSIIKLSSDFYGNVNIATSYTDQFFPREGASYSSYVL